MVGSNPGMPVLNSLGLAVWSFLPSPLLKLLIVPFRPAKSRDRVDDDCDAPTKDRDLGPNLVVLTERGDVYNDKECADGRKCSEMGSEGFSPSPSEGRQFQGAFCLFPDFLLCLQYRVAGDPEFVGSGKEPIPESTGRSSILLDGASKDLLGRIVVMMLQLARHYAPSISPALSSSRP